jgi:hypothetical protein
MQAANSIALNLRAEAHAELEMALRSMTSTRPTSAISCFLPSPPRSTAIPRLPPGPLRILLASPTTNVARGESLAPQSTQPRGHGAPSVGERETRGIGATRVNGRRQRSCSHGMASGRAARHRRRRSRYSGWGRTSHRARKGGQWPAGYQESCLAATHRGKSSRGRRTQ